MDEQRYLLDNQVAAAGERFAALAELFDPSTHRHLDQVGLTEGWRCWEVGAGGSALTAWLSARVGAIGKVVATDIDVAWAQEAPRAKDSTSSTHASYSSTSRNATWRSARWSPPSDPGGGSSSRTPIRPCSRCRALKRATMQSASPTSCGRAFVH
jgi:hypothetical protein